MAAIAPTYEAIMWRRPLIHVKGRLVGTGHEKKEFRTMKQTVTLLALALPLVMTSKAEAIRERVGQIPNAPNSCNTCHTAGGGSARNLFGMTVEATLDDADVDWGAVCPQDSDGDSFSNGVELGDPSCMFPQVRPGPALSDPADINSVPPTMDAGMPDTGAMDDMGSTDTGAPDMGPPDMGADTGAPDMGTADTGPMPTVDMGSTAPPDAGTPQDSGSAAAPTLSPEDDVDGGCTCAQPITSGAPLAVALLPLVGLLALRRQRGFVKAR